MMTSIGLTFLSKFNEIKVPLPHKLRVLLKESICKNLSGISDTSIALFPESVVTSESRDTTGSIHSSPGNHYYVFLSHHMLCCLLWCALNRLSFILIWCILHSLFQCWDNSSSNIGAYFIKLIDFISETLQVNWVHLLDLLWYLNLLLCLLCALHFNIIWEIRSSSLNNYWEQ
jgi:hypothetical protein